MNSACTMSKGKGPTSQIASASSKVALYEWRSKRAHKKGEDRAGDEGQRGRPRDSLHLSLTMRVPPDFGVLVIALVEPIAHEQPIGQRRHYAAGQYSQGKTHPIHIHVICLLHSPFRCTAISGSRATPFPSSIRKAKAAGVARCSRTPLDWVVTIYQQAP